MGRLRTWRSAFLTKLKGRPETPTKMETGFRELFVEKPIEPAAPETPEARRRREYLSVLEALRNASSNLSETQRSDNVDDFTKSVEQFRDGLGHLTDALPERHPDELSRAFDGIVRQLASLMEWRIEQVAKLRWYIRKHCPSGLAAKILQDSFQDPFARAGDRQARNDWAPRCSGEEHVYQTGEARCDCGRVAVRAAPAPA